MYTIELKTLMDDQMFEIFDFDMPFYCDSEQAKYEWQCKFLRKYAFYDINSETVARWKWMLETKLIEVMPYYTKLYETEVKARDIEFLLNKDYRETFMKDVEGTNTGNETVDTTGKDTSTSGGTATTNGTTSGTGKTTETQNSTNTSKVSNIDNGNGDVGLTQGYLTGMAEDKVVGTTSQDTENSQTANQTQTNSANSTLDKTGKTISAKTGTDKQKENYILEGKGNIGTTSSAALLKEWREVLIDIDRLLLDECKDLFLMVF